jgi:hypothetical protein
MHTDGEDDDGEDDDGECDFDWLGDTDRILHVADHSLAPEPMTHIWIHHLCVSSDNSLFAISKERVPLAGGGGGDPLAHVAPPDAALRLDAVFLYNVTLPPDRVQQYALAPLDPGARCEFFRRTPGAGSADADVRVAPSLFAFHPVNCIFAIWKQPLVSILKKNSKPKTHRVSFAAARRTRKGLR